MIEALQRLFGNRSDPTANWGPFHLPTPDFNIASMTFGALRFGEEFQAASFLGRPDHFQWTMPKYCELLYALGGFQLDFKDGKFAYAAFFLGPDRHLPKHRNLQFSKPCLRGFIPDGLHLSPDLVRSDIAKFFGQPKTVDEDADETILFYERQSVTMEFELDGKHERLKRWNVYPTKEE